MIRLFGLLFGALLAAVSGAESGHAGSAPAPDTDYAGPENVLLLINEDALDADQNGRNDDREIAEYYAARRGVPAENMLTVKAGRSRNMEYRQFYHNVLAPLAAKLRSKTADGRLFSARILYILLMPGMPHVLNTNHNKSESPLHPGYGKGPRSLDQWLVSAEENFAAGFCEETGRPGRRQESIRLGSLRIRGEPLDQIKFGNSTLGQIPVGNTHLGDIEVRQEGKLGEVVFDGRKLGDVLVGHNKLGEIEAGTEKAPQKLGEIDICFMHLGALSREVVLPVFNAFSGTRPTSFKQLRTEDPRKFGFYLVSRLGNDPASARRCVDGAIYAERYLRGNEALHDGPQTFIRPAIWLDQKFGFAFDQVAAQINCVAQVQPGVLFKPGAAGPLAPWPLVMDNDANEIGMPLGEGGKDGLHKPTVRARIAAVMGSSLVLEGKRLKSGQAPLAPYFSPGWEITVAGNDIARATILAVDTQSNRLTISSSEGFKAGDEAVSVWPGSFPAKDCFYFFGFYGLGQFEDVFAFPPGAIGIHVDSACMKWANGSLSRGIAGTFGVTKEPFSSGIPYGDKVLRALARGNDLVEAMTGALLSAQRWVGVIFGDPLYAPFRGKKLPDRTKPVLENIRAYSGDEGVRITASLGGATPDELSDVALFRIEYGPDTGYGKAVDYYDWRKPEKSRGVFRDYCGYARFCSREITGLQKGQTLHFRVLARDFAGNETAGPDMTCVY